MFQHSSVIWFYFRQSNNDASKATVSSSLVSAIQVSTETFTTVASPSISARTCGIGCYVATVDRKWTIAVKQEDLKREQTRAGRLKRRTYQSRKTGKENVLNQEDWKRERTKSGRLDKRTYQSRKIEKKKSLPEREGWKRQLPEREGWKRQLPEREG